jgi:hypothetical protein
MGVGFENDIDYKTHYRNVDMEKRGGKRARVTRG